MAAAARTPARDVAAELAFLTRALKSTRAARVSVAASGKGTRGIAEP